MRGDQLKLGILVTIVSGFGKKGFYHSQEIGLGKELTAMGHEVCIYKCVPKTEQYKEEPIDRNLIIKYIPVKKVGVHGVIDVAYLDPTMKGLLSFADTQLFLPHVFRFCKKNGIRFVPYVGIAHSFQQSAKSKVMDVLFSVGTLQYYKDTLVLAKTVDAKRELESLGVKHCEVAPVGLDPKELRTDFRDSDRNELRAKYGFCKDDTIILFVARLKPEKRPLDMITIFDHVCRQNSFKLLIVGEGPLRGMIDEKVMALGLSDRVTIIDRIPYEDMWEIHRISDFFVNLRAEEIFGMAVMEAVYYETSVAAINAPGPSTILQNMEGHKICSSDAEVEAWLLSKYPDISALKKSSDQILKEFTWHTCASKFVDAVQKSRLKA